MHAEDLELDVMLSGIAETGEAIRAQLGDVQGGIGENLPAWQECYYDVQCGSGAKCCDGYCVGADYDCGEGAGVDLKTTPGGGGGGGLPGGGVDDVYAVDVVLAAWDLEAQPYALYTIQYGDTFCGLGATYLGGCARGMEIYHTGNNTQIIGPDPNKITTQGPIAMPEEARQNLINWINKGQPPGTRPGNTPPATIVDKAKKHWPLVVAGLVVLGVGGYAVSQA